MRDFILKLLTKLKAELSKNEITQEVLDHSYISGIAFQNYMYSNFEDIYQLTPFQHSELSHQFKTLCVTILKTFNIELTDSNLLEVQNHMNRGMSHRVHESNFNKYLH